MWLFFKIFLHFYLDVYLIFVVFIVIFSFFSRFILTINNFWRWNLVAYLCSKIENVMCFLCGSFFFRLCMFRKMLAISFFPPFLLQRNFFLDLLRDAFVLSFAFSPLFLLFFFPLLLCIYQKFLLAFSLALQLLPDDAFVSFQRFAVLIQSLVCVTCIIYKSLKENEIIRRLNIYIYIYLDVYDKYRFICKINYFYKFFQKRNMFLQERYIFFLFVYLVS